ncbi:MAG TPA: PfkB family carbohydrate kinase, partial [Chloroflexota bacterium]
TESRAAIEAGILLMTMGERGALVRVNGRETLVPACPVKTPYTIGAGDTFVAAFVVALLSGDDPIEAATKAARFTEEMLRQRC